MWICRWLCFKVGISLKIKPSKKLVRFERQSFRQRFNVMVHKIGKVSSLGFNSRCIVSVGSDKTIKILDFITGEILSSLDSVHDGPIRKVIVQEER